MGCRILHCTGFIFCIFDITENNFGLNFILTEDDNFFFDKSETVTFSINHDLSSLYIIQ